MNKRSNKERSEHGRGVTSLVLRLQPSCSEKAVSKRAVGLCQLRIDTQWKHMKLGELANQNYSSNRSPAHDGDLAHEDPSWAIEIP